VSLRSADQLFVVRTWLELPSDPRSLRGQIDHIASGRRRYFANFGDLCDFIAGAEAFVPAPPSAQTSGDCATVEDEE
jgi:hypothetical protein